MSRTNPFFEFISVLRARRTLVAASQLAQELDVSLRTIYRDIETRAETDIRGR